MIEPENHIAFIDEKPFDYTEGEMLITFLERHLGKGDIPTLCYDPNLNPVGACRLCTVEISPGPDQDRKVVASCHTPVQPGLHVYPHTEKIKRMRKNILGLVAADYPTDTLADGEETEFSRLLKRLNVQPSANGIKDHGRRFEPDHSHPYMISDLSKCINCNRCVAACDEIQGEFVLSMFGRGYDSHIIKGANETFLDSDCVSCGACVQTCPTGAITDIFKSNIRTPDEHITRTVCTYCGVGCNLEVIQQDGKITKVRAPADAEVNKGHLCLKGRYAFGFYNHPDRLQSPMIRENGKFKEVSWEEAYDFIAEKLEKIKAEYGPDHIAGISSSRCTNEENYLMQKFIRAVIGTNNIDGCARICHAPTAAGMQKTFGTGAATNSIKDLEHTDCILVIGANPTEAHPVTGAKIKQAAMKGTTLIVIDPRETTLAKYADIHLQLRPGTNVALLNMMLYYIISEGYVDHDFVDSRTEGFEEFQQEILNVDLNEAEEVTGVPREMAKMAALVYAKANNAMSFHGLGVTEHHQGTYGVTLVADLAMITGNIGRPGVGVNPLRGQNNVQGSADMGVQPNQGAGYMDVSIPENRLKYEKHYGVPLPDKIGYTIPEMIDAAHTGELKALWIMGEDVVQTEPNTDKVRKALQNLDLLVMQEIFMSETAKLATVILPGSSFFEKSGTFTNGERRIQRVNAVVQPLHNSKPDGQIVTEIMNRMGYEQPPYDAASVLREISGIVPFFKGVKWEELGENGKQWPVKEDGEDTEILHTETFGRGKGLFVHTEFTESPEIENYGMAYPLILTTNRELEHYNCGTMTRRTPNREIVPEDVLLMNPYDAVRKGIQDEDVVRMKSARGEINIRVHVTDEVKPGVVSSTFHFPEIMLNTVTSDVYDEVANCPEYKVVAVDVNLE